MILDWGIIKPGGVFTSITTRHFMSPTLASTSPKSCSCGRVPTHASTAAGGWPHAGPPLGAAWTCLSARPPVRLFDGLQAYGRWLFGLADISCRSAAWHVSYHPTQSPTLDRQSAGLVDGPTKLLSHSLHLANYVTSRWAPDSGFYFGWHFVSSVESPHCFRVLAGRSIVIVQRGRGAAIILTRLWVIVCLVTAASLPISHGSTFCAAHGSQFWCIAAVHSYWSEGVNRDVQT